MIAAAGIGWRIGGARILEDISLEVAAGELLGIIGPNGAGKSSLVNILSGVTRPTQGRVTLGESDVTRLSSTRRAHRGLARSFQTSALFDGLSARENVRLAVQDAGAAPFSPPHRVGASPSRRRWRASGS